MSEDDKKIRKFQEFQARQMKRDRKPKRKRAYDDNDSNNNNATKNKGELVLCFATASQSCLNCADKLTIKIHYNRQFQSCKIPGIKFRELDDLA